LYQAEAAAVRAARNPRAPGKEPLNPRDGVQKKKTAGLVPNRSVDTHSAGVAARSWAVAGSARAPRRGLSNQFASLSRCQSELPNIWPIAIRRLK